MMKKAYTFIIAFLFILSNGLSQGIISDKAFISLESGSNLVLENGAGIYLTSDATGTSSLIDDQNITLSGSGTIEVERYIPQYVGSAGWHILSSPISSQAIRPEFVANGNPVPGNDDFYKWDELTNFWINTKDDDGNWNTNFEDNFVVGQGYLVAYESNVSKTFTGTLNSGDFTYNSSTSPAITYTANEGEGWNLMGNPYPSAIDWDELSKTNIDASVYVYDGDAGQYISWNGTVGALTDGIVPPMNGFFIKASSGASFSIPNTSRLHTTTNFYKNTLNDLIVLSIEGNGFADKTYIHFNENATTGFDRQFDAYKLFGIEEAPQLYTSTGEANLSINEFPYSIEESIPLNLRTGDDGFYTIILNEGTTWNSDVLFLHDLKDDINVNLMQSNQYEFYAEKEDEPERFRLYFQATGAIDEYNPLQEVIIRYDNGALIIHNPTGAELELAVFDLCGRLLIKAKIDKSSLQRISTKSELQMLLLRLSSSEYVNIRKIITN